MNPITDKILTTFVDNRTNIVYTIKTERLKNEPSYFFIKRHRLKVKAKKYWLKNQIIT